MRLLAIQHNCIVSPEFNYNRPHGLDEYVLVLAHSPAYFHSGDMKYLLEPSQLFIYKKHQPQRFYSTGEPFSHDWFHFDMSEDALCFYNTLDIPFGKPLTLSDPFVISELIKNLASEYLSFTPHRQEIIDLYIRYFFTRLSDIIHYPAKKLSDHPHYQLLSSLRNELYNFPYHDWTLDTLAERAHMSRSWVQHNWKTLFGRCYQDDLIKSRVEFAKNLLYHTEESIEHVALLCGYETPTHFMRQFKKATGLTPSGYRKKFSILDDEPRNLKEFEMSPNYGSNRRKRSRQSPDNS